MNGTEWGAIGIVIVVVCAITILLALEEWKDE